MSHGDMPPPILKALAISALRRVQSDGLTARHAQFRVWLPLLVVHTSPHHSLGTGGQILGYAFVPRIRDLPSKRLYVFDPWVVVASAILSRPRLMPSASRTLSRPMRSRQGEPISRVRKGFGEPPAPARGRPPRTRSPRPCRRSRWQVASTPARSESPNGRAVLARDRRRSLRYPASTLGHAFTGRTVTPAIGVRAVLRGSRRRFQQKGEGRRTCPPPPIECLAGQLQDHGERRVR